MIKFRQWLFFENTEHNISYAKSILKNRFFNNYNKVFKQIQSFIQQLGDENKYSKLYPFIAAIFVPRRSDAIFKSIVNVADYLITSGLRIKGGKNTGYFVEINNKKFGEHNIDDFLKWVEGFYLLRKLKENSKLKGDEIPKNIPSISKNGITILYARDVFDAIALGGDTNFCISRAGGGNAFYEYRRKNESIYFIIDKNRQKPDPLRKVVVRVQAYSSDKNSPVSGYILTDMDNDDGRIHHPFGKKKIKANYQEEYFDYLRKFGFNPEKIFKPVPMTKQEKREYDKIMFDADDSMEWFENLSVAEQFKYSSIRDLSDVQLLYIIDKAQSGDAIYKVMVENYLNQGIKIGIVPFMKIISKNQWVRTYERKRMDRTNDIALDNEITWYEYGVFRRKISNTNLLLNLIRKYFEDGIKDNPDYKILADSFANKLRKSMQFEKELGIPDSLALSNDIVVSIANSLLNGEFDDDKFPNEEEFSSNEIVHVDEDISIGSYGELIIKTKKGWEKLLHDLFFLEDIGRSKYFRPEKSGISRFKEKFTKVLAKIVDYAKKHEGKYDPIVALKNILSVLDYSYDEHKRPMIIFLHALYESVESFRNIRFDDSNKSKKILEILFEYPGNPFDTKSLIYGTSLNPNNIVMLQDENTFRHFIFDLLEKINKNRIRTLEEFLTNQPHELIKNDDTIIIIERILNSIEREKLISIITYSRQNTIRLITSKMLAVNSSVKTMGSIVNILLYFHLAGRNLAEESGEILRKYPGKIFVLFQYIKKSPDILKQISSFMGGEQFILYFINYIIDESNNYDGLIDLIELFVQNKIVSREGIERLANNILPRTRLYSPFITSVLWYKNKIFAPYFVNYFIKNISSWARILTNEIIESMLHYVSNYENFYKNVSKNQFDWLILVGNIIQHAKANNIKFHIIPKESKKILIQSLEHIANESTGNEKKLNFIQSLIKDVNTIIV